MSDHAGWEPIERDLDAVERNMIRDSLAEIVQAHQLDLKTAVRLVTDAVNEFRETVEYRLVPKKQAVMEKYLRPCQNQCGRQVYIEGQHPVCAYCRERASRKPCPDCGTKIAPDSTRCVHCAIKQTHRKSRKKLIINDPRPNDKLNGKPE